MPLIFLIFLIMVWVFIPFHFLSVSHTYLEEKYGEEKGKKLGKVLGMISGWGIFIALFGLWLSPQPRFYILILQQKIIQISIFGISLSLIRVLISTPFILLSVWLGIAGVKVLSLEVSETHKAKRIIDSGIYSKIRHPQYLAAILAHMGFSILFAAFYSLLASPLIIFYNYITAWKEERELIKEFGEEYKKYRETVPMFLPRILKR
ncbi:MAG: methyltransferase family protein [Promethearchaeia archaeon]